MVQILSDLRAGVEDGALLTELASAQPPIGANPGVAERAFCAKWLLGSAEGVKCEGKW